MENEKGLFYEASQHLTTELKHKQHYQPTNAQEITTTTAQLKQQVDESVPKEGKENFQGRSKH